MTHDSSEFEYSKYEFKIGLALPYPDSGQQSVGHFLDFPNQEKKEKEKELVMY